MTSMCHAPAPHARHHNHCMHCAASIHDPAPGELSASADNTSGTNWKEQQCYMHHDKRTRYFMKVDTHTQLGMIVTGTVPLQALHCM